MNTDPPQPPAGQPPAGPINGYTVTVATSLAGSKRAVRRGATLFVSPAMWDMISTAEGPAELAFIMNHITIVDLPYTPPGYFNPVYAPAFALRTPEPLT